MVIIISLSYFLFVGVVFFSRSSFCFLDLYRSKCIQIDSRKLITNKCGIVAGFRVVDRGCCGIGRNQGQITCLPFATPCYFRNQYVFWDAFHPTQAANAILAQRAFSGPPSDCYPINVQQLSLLN